MLWCNLYRLFALQRSRAAIDTQFEIVDTFQKGEEIVSAIGNNGYHVGELSPEVLAEFAFSNKRQLKQFTMGDEDEVKSLLDNFMGVDGQERREFVG